MIYEFQANADLIQVDTALTVARLKLLNDFR